MSAYYAVTTVGYSTNIQRKLYVCNCTHTSMLYSILQSLPIMIRWHLLNQSSRDHWTPTPTLTPGVLVWLIEAIQ